MNHKVCYEVSSDGPTRAVRSVAKFLIFEIRSAYRRVRIVQIFYEKSRQILQ